MYITKEQLNELIKIENKLAKVKKYYNEFCILSTIIEDNLQKRIEHNTKNYKRIKEKRKNNKNYARGVKKIAI